MPDITTTTLACGLPFIAERMSGVKSASLCWLVPGGSSFDPAEREGLSTMHSELLLRGCGPYSSREHADAMDRLGASRVTELGTYTMRIGSTMLGQRMAETLPFLVEMALRPRMDEASVEAARDLALQSLDSLKDDPAERASLRARERHHPSPLNRSGLGTEGGLTGATREELASSWSAACVPKGSVLAVAGDVDNLSLERRLNDLLHEWSGERAYPALGATPARGYEHQEDASNQVQIFLLHDAPPETSDDAVLERIVTQVLSGGMSGRLFLEVREKRGLCYSVSASYRADKDFGSVSAYVGTTPERAQESLDVLTAELIRITQPGGEVTQEEFDRARVGMKSGLVFSSESTGARAVALAADYRRVGRARSLAEIAARIDRVTLDEGNAYVKRRPLGRLTVQTLGPKPLTPPALAV